MSQYDKLGEMLSDALENGFERYKSKAKPTEEKYSAEQIFDSNANSQKTDFQENQSIHNTEEKKTGISKNSKVFTDKASLAILGLKDSATEENIKEAYRTLLKKYHPDSVPDFPEMQKTAARRTREIVEAYKKLITNKK